MGDLGAQNDLSQVARKLAASSNVYSGFVGTIAGKNVGASAMARVINQQFKIDRTLLGETGRLLNRLASGRAGSPALSALGVTNSNLTKMVAQAFPTTGFAKTLGTERLISQAFKGIQPSPSLVSVLAGMNTTRTLSASIAAQAKFAHLDGLRLGRLAGFDAARSRIAAANLDGLTRSYRSLIETVGSTKSLAPHLPLIATYPPVECYREIDLLESVTLEDPSSSREMDSEVETLTGELPSIDELVAEFDESLCPLLLGAREALRSSNPDKARHVTTSLRELFTQVLHALAPDAQVLQWITDPRLVEDGKPTREARLRYICRAIDHDPLTRFVDHDVRGTITFVRSLNEGTHKTTSRLTSHQLASLVARMESLLVFLLQVHNEV